MQYVPHPPEPVLGIVIARHAEGYRVDIGSSQAAALDALAFEGATKRNKPNLKVRAGSDSRRLVLSIRQRADRVLSNRWEPSCTDSCSQRQRSQNRRSLASIRRRKKPPDSENSKAGSSSGMSSSADVAREFCHLYHPELAG